MCVSVDGLGDSSLIRNWDIDVSSNEEQKADIRPGTRGWSPAAGDKKNTMTIYVGDALRYGGQLRLPKAKCVGKYDVALIGKDGEVKRFNVSLIQIHNLQENMSFEKHSSL